MSNPVRLASPTLATVVASLALGALAGCKPALVGFRETGKLDVSGKGYRYSAIAKTRRRGRSQPFLRGLRDCIAKPGRDVTRVRNTMGARTCSTLLAAVAVAALSASAAVAQNANKPASPGDSGFFYTDLKTRVTLEYLPPGSKTAAFQMICPKGLGKIQFDEFMGAAQDGPITLVAKGKTLVLQGKKMTGERGVGFVRANTSTAEAVILGIRDSGQIEVTAPGAHFVAQTTEGDRGEVGVFFTECDEGEGL
jgi:hypothetical protein